MRTPLFVAASAVVLSVTTAAAAQAPEPDKMQPPAAAPAAVTLPAPAMTPPLTLNSAPFSADAGPFGKVYVSGQFTGLALAQSATVPNPLPGAGNSDALLDVSNAMVTVQTTGKPLTFTFQAGAYSFPTLGTPYIRPSKNIDAYFGALPVAYAKYAITDALSIQAGSMPTLIGAEYAFTYQNTNIERGLVWNQEPVISKGVQVNYAKGPLTVSASLNDGFDSDHYNWVSGLASYAIDSSNTIAINGGFNTSHTLTNKFRAPNTLNNSGILDVSYAYTKGPLYINPYFQYTKVGADRQVGVLKSAETYSVAVLAKYSLTPELALGGRAEYIASSSTRCRASDGPFCAPTSLLYGPGSDAWSLTFTPSWQRGVFFARGEVSYVRLESFTRGFGFGRAFAGDDQVRGLIETGILF